MGVRDKRGVSGIIVMEIKGRVTANILLLYIEATLVGQEVQ